MRPALHIVFALGAALAAVRADAYCVRNAITDRAVHAAVVPSKMPTAVRTFSETVAGGKEFCCNPKNADCNPDRAGDEATLTFEVNVEAAPPAQTPQAPLKDPAAAPLKCGVADARAQGRVMAIAPVRGFLRFEPNARYDPRRKVGGDNPPYLLKALTADNKLVVTYPCPARGLSETPHS